MLIYPEWKLLWVNFTSEATQTAIVCSNRVHVSLQGRIIVLVLCSLLGRKVPERVRLFPQCLLYSFTFDFQVVGRLAGDGSNSMV